MKRVPPLNSEHRTAVAWPTLDRSTAPATEVELVVPEDGRVVGAVYRLRFPDGHREAAAAICDADDWVTYLNPLPAEPPGPEFAAAFVAAQAWLKEGS